MFPGSREARILERGLLRISWTLARAWEGNRSLESQIKAQKNTPRLCPECNPQACDHMNGE